MSVKLVNGISYKRSEISEYLMVLRVEHNNIMKYVFVDFFENRKGFNMVINSKEEYINRYSIDGDLNESNIKNIYSYQDDVIRRNFNIKELYSLKFMKLTNLISELYKIF